MATAFATDEKHIQLTLAVYFAGLAIGQLIYGPLADRFGRRGPLLSGVILFTLASFACAFAPSLEWLIGARFVQALGGCAGMVISRAVVSDKCDAVGSAKVYSQLMLVMGWHRSSRRWRWADGRVVGLAVDLPDAFAVQRDGRRRRGGRFAGNLPGPSAAPAVVRVAAPLWRAVVRSGLPRLCLDRRYLDCRDVCLHRRFALRLYQTVWRTRRALWLAVRLQRCGFILVAQVNARLLARRGPAFLLSRTVWVYLLAALALLGIAALRTEALWPLLVPLFICIASLGCILPNTSACAMSGQGARAGSASALLGCIQFGVAAGAASLVGCCTTARRCRWPRSSACAVCWR
jgi:DHA1 family bicyclomycin/chloramphenicol resistance-like MFS transporter